MKWGPDLMRTAGHRASQTVRLAVLIAIAMPIAADAQTGDSAPAAAASTQSSPAVVDQGQAEGLQPRLELFVPSVLNLIKETKRSRTGLFVDHLGRYFRELAGTSAEGVNAEEVNAILEAVAQWSDVSISGALFAPDMEGRPQWSIRLNISLADLLKRMGALLASDPAREIFAGITVESASPGAFVVTLPDSPIANLLPGGNAASYITSHRDLHHPEDLTLNPEASAPDAAPLVSCRLNLANTEKDSGATVFSSFSALTAIDYIGRVDSKGQWIERLQVHWPMLSGMAIKTFFGTVKDSFFVPDAAFGSAVFSTMPAPSFLESMAGLGPQVMMDQGGHMTVIGEPAAGPISGRVKDQLCVTVLPGTGFLPLPDVVIQARIKREESFADDMRASIEKINEIYEERDERPPWHEEQIADRHVFWSNGSQTPAGVIMPAAFRPILFVTSETDARERERQYLVLALTSTSPQRLVRRWLDLPRTKERHILPTQPRTNGQVWVNWGRVYRWAEPYFDLAMSIVSTDVLAPGMKEAEDKLSDAYLTVDTGYTGMTLSHMGPLPLGALALPMMAGSAVVTDEQGGSDLARERLASRRLKVLYHHCKLFRQDLGRWPAEVAELDGYVDFAGNPQLLDLELSSRKQWSDWLEGWMDSDEGSDAEEDEQEDEQSDDEIDDELFVIGWGRDHWTLGLAPGTLEHLERLYIDQDGDIHRVVKRPDGGGQVQEKEEPVAQEAGNAGRPTDAAP